MRELFHAFAESGQQLLDLHLGYEGANLLSELYEERIVLELDPKDPTVSCRTRCALAGNRKNPGSVDARLQRPHHAATASPTKRTTT